MTRCTFTLPRGKSTMLRCTSAKQQSTFTMPRCTSAMLHCTFTLRHCTSAMCHCTFTLCHCTSAKWPRTSAKPQKTPTIQQNTPQTRQILPAKPGTGRISDRRKLEPAKTKRAEVEIKWPAPPIFPPANSSREGRFSSRAATFQLVKTIRRLVRAVRA